MIDRLINFSKSDFGHVTHLCVPMMELVVPAHNMAKCAGECMGLCKSMCREFRKCLKYFSVSHTLFPCHFRKQCAN